MNEEDRILSQEPSCFRCRFWDMKPQDRSDAAWPDDLSASCLRHAPKPGKPEDAYQYRVKPLWPTVKSVFWCGDFEALRPS